MIECERLLLLPATVQTLRLEATRELERFAALLGVAAPEHWPPDLYDEDAVAWSLRELEENPDRAPWNTYYFVLKAPRVLIGAGGFMNGPCAQGSVELGYSVLAAHRRQGYASEATAGMVRRAFAEAGVQRVVAHTYPELIASIGVLEKNGFRLDGPGEQERTVRYVRERA
jgi:RimJ/RimL family protein N-acetyltransferase